MMAPTYATAPRNPDLLAPSFHGAYDELGFSVPSATQVMAWVGMGLSMAVLAIGLVTVAQGYKRGHRHGG